MRPTEGQHGGGGTPETGGKGPNAYTAYIAVALVCALASAAVPLVALLKFNVMTDLGMWAVPAMGLPAALLGALACLFVYLTARGGPREAPRPPAPPDGAFRQAEPFEGRG